MKHLVFSHNVLFDNKSTSTSVNDTTSTVVPPEYNFDLIAYVLIGILGALIWDVFSNLGEDFDLVTRSPIRSPVVVYFLSRINTLLCFCLIVVFATSTNVECETLSRVTRWFFAFVLSSTTLLLVLRARAVYKNRKWAANMLSVMWLGVVAASLVETQLSSPAIRQESTGRCALIGTITPFIIATTIVPVANDILLFCAITWRLVQNSSEDITMRKGLLMAILGNGLPSFSRTLLRDGQAYFLTTVVVSIITIGIFCIAPPALGAYSVLLAFINVGVMHLMACKIYRKTRLGGYSLDNIVAGSELSLRTIEFRPRIDSSFAHTTDGDNSRLDPSIPTRLARHSGCGNVRCEDLEQQKIGDTNPEEVHVVER